VPELHPYLWCSHFGLSLRVVKSTHHRSPAVVSDLLHDRQMFRSLPRMAHYPHLVTARLASCTPSTWLREAGPA
jgi:hypothetical protein